MFTFSTGLFLGFVLCLVLAITIKIVENYEEAQENKLKKQEMLKARNFSVIPPSYKVASRVQKDEDTTGKFIRPISIV
jgi:hypothetical protein